MWEIMWSWWWVKPLPSEKHFIRKDNNIKENNNNLIKNWLRASLKKRSRQSRCKSVNNNNNHKRSKDQVKFLYESKSGKSFRQSGNYGEYINPYFQKNTIGCCTEKTGETNPCIKMTSTVEDQIVPPNPVEVDSDPEDDPGRMLNVWLGQLQKDMASPTENNGENGFHKVAHPKNGGGTVSSTAPIVKRRQQHDQNNTDAIIKTNLKNQYRCSLINLEETQDDELDAILGELSILESQFQEEIAENSVNNAHSVVSSTQVEPAKGPTTTTKQSSPVASVTSSTSRSSPTSSSDTAAASKKQSNSVNGKRTESPDTDSAFCDNLSVLSSCSTSSRSNGIQSSSGISSATSTPEEQEAKLKAEKIKLAIEKIKEANIKKIFIKVFTSDGSAKSLLVDEKMSVSHVTRILAEKNHVKLDPRWTLVELIPDLYMERVYEDHENLVENCLMWTVDSKNTLWFIERPEKYDVFVRPERYLLGTSSSQQGDTMEDHARQELLEEYFSSTGVGAPEMEGHVWLKTDNKKSWKKFFFVLRTSGLYYAPKGKKSSKDLVCLATFDVNQVYYGAGWKKKYKAPTDFCFAIKHPKIQAKSPKYIRYLCVDTEMEMHQWVTGMRVAKNGKQLFTNYRSIEEDITHADIDILTSKRFSVNSPNTLQINGQTNTKISNSSPARTPNSSSENKSLDSALSSGIVSDASHSLISAESKDTFDIIEVTPVNTIERNSGQLRRSMSKTSSTSSSSGCLSDRCSSGGSAQQPPNHPMGFESDFPMGGTIKKRPSALANVKLPLTNTTRGIIRDSDEELSIGSGDNIRIGGGGTLLRSAVRQSLRKNSLVYESNERTAGIQSQHQQKQQQQQHLQPPQVQPKHQLHTVQVHHATADHPDPYSEEVNCLMEDLPPPPRAESIDQHLNAAGHELPTPSFDVDDLPPPPPEMSLPPPPTQQQQQQPQTMPNLPTYLPLIGKKQPANKPIKRISFDDDVQVIGVSELDNNVCTTMTTDNPYGTLCTTDNPYGTLCTTGNSAGTRGILTYIKPEPYQANPKKLYSMDSNCQAAPPREFLHDLQKVMTKKWQVAEKCKVDQKASPHTVLGFRDNDQIHQLVGHGQDYSRDESVGAWVLHSQQYAQHKMMASRLQNQDIVGSSTKNLQKEPLYAVCSKNGVNNAKIQPSNNGPAHGPAVYAPGHGPAQSNHHNARAVCSSPKKIPMPVAPPVVLREPPVMPLPMPPAAEPTYVTITKPHHPFANVQPPQHCHQYPPHHMANLKKRAPPPPRRSENTHLTS